MSIFKTPYQTTVGKNSVVSKVDLALKETLVLSDFVNDKSQEQPYLKMIAGVESSEKNVPAFVHPIEVTSVDGNKYLCMDMRPFVRVDNGRSGEDSIIVRNTSEYKLAEARMIMTKSWIVNGPQSISGLSMLPCSVFASWISEGISHRFALDPLDQLKLSILSAFYYQSLFLPVDEFDNETKEKMNSVCMKVTRAPAKIVYETTDKVNKISSVIEFCDAVKSILQNSRLVDFNAGFLITVLKNSWFGTNAADIMAVSLEHPPTWVSVIYTALSERTFRNSNLCRISERYNKDTSFVKAFVTLANDVSGKFDDK
jgi:hypothetical protein